MNTLSRRYVMHCRCPAVKAYDRIGMPTAMCALLHGGSWLPMQELDRRISPAWTLHGRARISSLPAAQFAFDAVEPANVSAWINSPLAGDQAYLRYPC